MTQIAEYYRYMQTQIEEKFHSLTADTMQEIKNKLKRKHNKE
jgi:DNA-binding transcriptional regulator GbsR (MarR family)